MLSFQERGEDMESNEDEEGDEWWGFVMECMTWEEVLLFVLWNARH